MIIYNLRTPESPILNKSIGVTGDNLTNELVFLIKNLNDSAMSFYIHLRFKDGSVNSVIPDSTEFTEEGTLIRWTVKKNDIFCHGFFELQIECNKEEAVMQTEIIRLFADESLPVEDKEYTNPNSETLALRDEIYALTLKLEQQSQLIEQNKEIIAGYNLDLKADKADTYTKTETESLLAQKENLSDKISDKRNIIDENVQYPSIGYLKGYYYDIDDMEEFLAYKADTSNVYTKSEIDSMLANFSPASTSSYALRSVEQNNSTSTIFTKEEVDVSE